MRLIIILFIAQLTTACMAHNSEEVDLQGLAEKSRKDAIEYITQLSDNCAYQDGYVCATSSLDKQASASGFSQMVDRSGTLPGAVFEVWPIAYEAFLEQDFLNDEQKKLKHYRVGFQQTSDGMTVLFRPLMLPQMVDGRVDGMMRATFGQEVRVNVDMDKRSVQTVTLGR